MSISETAAPRPVLVGPVPPAKPLPFFEFLRVARQNAMAAIPRIAYEKPILKLRIGLAEVVLVNDPAGVKRVLLDNVANYPKAPEEIAALGAAFGDGLLTSQGDKWRSHRRLMAPSFDHKSIVAYAPAMTETIESYLRKWDEMPRGTTVDIAREMTELTLKIISRTMFSSDSENIGQLVGDTLRRGTDAMTFDLWDALPLIGPWRLGQKLKHIHAIFANLDQSIYRLIAAREKRDASTGTLDLLDRLLAARDGEMGVKLSNEEVRDEVVIIFLAGHETTAVAMTFVWYLLSQHPAIEARLHREIDTVLAGRTPTYEDLEKLPYSRMVIEEAMRLYPPAPGLSNRQVLADDLICGEKVSKKSSVLVVPWVLHRHKTLWEDPERFDPERFAPEHSAQRPRFAYLPFGGGPRICIGAALAMTEAQLILAAIAQRYRLRFVPGQDIELLHRVTLRPRNGIKLALEAR